MFTKRDCLKELTEYLVSNKNTQVETFLENKNNNHDKKYGFARVITYTYTNYGIEVVYNKWFVEGYDYAVKMGLPGCEYHDRLVAGTGVKVISKKFGNDIFYGRAAEEIINACEKQR